MDKFKTLCTAMLLVAVLVSGAALQAQETGRWTSGAAMPSERSEVAVAEVGGKVYVIGGFAGQRELEIYDPATDSWSRGATVPRSLHHTAAVGLNDKLYVVGGYADGWTPIDDLYEYDPGSDRWRRLATTNCRILGNRSRAGTIRGTREGWRSDP
jgi:N-acetylneuraminic acid mutarotase